VKELRDVMNAIARVHDKPHNVYKANREMWEVLEEKSHQALLQFDDAMHAVGYVQDLEAENAELRRRLKEAGISDKIMVKEEVAA